MPKITSQQSVIAELVSLGCEVIRKRGVHCMYVQVFHPSDKRSPSVWSEDHYREEWGAATLAYYRGIARRKL